MHLLSSKDDIITRPNVQRTCTLAMWHDHSKCLQQLYSLQKTDKAEQNTHSGDQLALIIEALHTNHCYESPRRDKPAQQFERGTQIEGIYKCGGWKHAFGIPGDHYQI